MRRSFASLMLVLCLGLFAGAGSLSAQAPDQPLPRHRGLWFSGGFGWGSLGCQDCGSRTGGLSGGLTLGGTISPKFLLGIGTTGWTKSENGATLTVGTLDARLRFYPSLTSGFFLTGGLGIGEMRASVSGFGSASETGVGAVLGLGWDIPISGSASLTPFWNGFAVNTANGDANVGQLGMSITIH